MKLRALQRHAVMAHGWLRPRLGDDGAWLDEPAAIVDAYYKTAWWLAVTADHHAAHRNLATIGERFLTPAGDLDPIAGPRLRERYPLIPHAHIAIGATLVGREELAARLLDFLSQHQHAEFGGWGDRADGPGSLRVDTISSACIGLAFLEGGRPEPARRAAAFLERVVSVQPAPETDLYTTLSGSGTALTQFKDETTRVDRRVNFATRFQVWHALGFPIMLLARLYEHDGDVRWLRLAEHFTALFDRSGQAWVDLSVGKAAWGFAILYRATGDPAYRRRSLRALRGIVSWQDADGGWLGCLDGAGGTSETVTSIGYEVGAELVTWLAAVGEILAAVDGSPWVAPARAEPIDGLNRRLAHASRVVARQRRLAPARRRRLARVVGRAARRLSR